MPALRALTRIIAREAARATDLAALGGIVAILPQGSKGFLAEAPVVAQLVGEVVRCQVHVNMADRPVFREIYAEALCTAIDNFRSKVAGLREPLSSEFRAAAECWRNIAGRQRDNLRVRAARHPMFQVFRAGDPVDRNQEAFVSRDRIVGRLEQQVMLATGCPGVVLYGR